jgi:hypothetical protein
MKIVQLHIPNVYIIVPFKVQQLLFGAQVPNLKR